MKPADLPMVGKISRPVLTALTVIALVAGPGTAALGGTPASALGGTPASAPGGTPASALGGTPASALGGTPASALGGTPAPTPPPASVSTPATAPVTASGPVTAADLATLSARVAALTAQAQAAVARLNLAAARSLTLRVDLDRLLVTQGQLQAQLDDQVRAAYEANQADPFVSLVDQLTPNDLQATYGITEQNQVTVDAGLVDQVSSAGIALARLRARLDQVRRQLLGPAIEAERAVEQAAALLAQEQSRYNAQIAAQLAALQALSGQLTYTVATQVSSDGLAVARAQAPIIAALNAAGPGIPSGYRLTTQVLAGIASWYGPGFIGNATSSGAPYDPEKLTCAMLAVPLGTVVHVLNTATGQSVNCLVNDRGPYVSGRIIDMSIAGATALGYTGLAQVTVTVLSPTG